jgi:cardiolipin synthase
MNTTPARPDIAAQKNYTKLVETSTGTPFRAGNDLVILQNGDEIFPAMLKAVRSAERTIEFSTYVYWKSDIATEFANALCERAKSGVEVRLLVDAVGAAIMNTRTVWQLERAGVKLAWFRPVRWPYLHKLNNRTHRKVLLVDREVGFTGGVGIADQWTGSADAPNHFRETHCRLAGPACADLLEAFAHNWHEATREQLEQPGPQHLYSAGNVDVHTTISTAGPRPTAVERLFGAVIAASHRNLWITTAYFVPTDEFTSALEAAARRGVDVRVLTNGPLTNHRVTRWAGHGSYARLLAGGVKIYEYQGTVLHSKVITADQAWASLGSTNFDARSLILNDELNIEVVDAALVRLLDQQFLADLQRSRQITGSVWLRRRWTNRVAEAGAGLFRGQL